MTSPSSISSLSQGSNLASWPSGLSGSISHLGRRKFGQYCTDFAACKCICHFTHVASALFRGGACVKFVHLQLVV